MSSLSVTGPINSGTRATYNDNDPRKSRTVVDYLVIENDAATATLPLNTAITKAVDYAASDSSMLAYVYGNAPLQNTSATRMGPKKVQVQLTFARTDLRDDPDQQVFTARIGIGYETVYRRAWLTISDGDKLELPDGTDVDCNGIPVGSNPVQTCSSSSSCYTTLTGSCRIPSYQNGLPNGDWYRSPGPAKLPVWMWAL